MLRGGGIEECEGCGPGKEIVIFTSGKLLQIVANCCKLFDLLWRCFLIHKHSNRRRVQYQNI
jgi:hypothetical protein